MARKDTTTRKRRQSKVTTSEVAEEEDKVNTDTDASGDQTVGKEEDAAEGTERTQEEEKQDEQDPQTDADIEVKGGTSTVTVSWAKNNEGGVCDDTGKAADTTDQTMEIDEPIISAADAVSTTMEAPSESTEANTKQELQESEECQMDVASGENESAATVTETCEKENVDGGSSGIKEETEAGEQKVVKEKKRKRKTRSTAESSPSKKTKLINDGLCIFVGNLNNSKTFEEVQNSLTTYFKTQSVLVQDIRLDRSKKHACLDLASETDVTTALSLNGETVLEKPMKIKQARMKSEDKVKVKATAEEKKAASDARCLFLKNVPYKATKEDILKLFHSAINIRFPGGTEGPKKGIAFVEFKDKITPKKIQQKKHIYKIKGRTLIVDLVGERSTHQEPKAKVEKKIAETKKQDERPPHKILYVGNLSYNVKKETLKSLFKKALGVTIVQTKGKPQGYAFVRFATVKQAVKARESSKNMKIKNREVIIRFADKKEKSAEPEVPTNSLIVVGLAEKTSAETLKSAFEGAIHARVVAKKGNGVSKKFGFVDFESVENCKAIREAMEGCEIDNKKVIVAYAKPKAPKQPPAAKASVAGRPAAQRAGQMPAAKSGRKDRKEKCKNGEFCIFVGNLNISKNVEEIKNSLASYFMTQSVLVQDIRLDRSKKHACLDLASEIDLTKALSLNGETVLEKPMKIQKAGRKSEEKENVKVKVKASAKGKKGGKQGAGTPQDAVKEVENKG